MSGFTSSAEGSIWTRQIKEIAPGIELVVDSFPVLNFTGAKYIFCVYNKTEQKSKLFDLSIARSGGEIIDSLFAKTGAGITMEVTVTNTGEVRVKNNNLFAVKVDFAKLGFG